MSRNVQLCLVMFCVEGTGRDSEGHHHFFLVRDKISAQVARQLCGRNFMEQEKYNDEILKAIAVFAAFAVLYKIGSLVFSWGKRFYQDSPILFYTCLITAMLTIAILIFRKLRQKYLNFKAEQEITNGKGDDSVYAGRTSEGKDVFVNLSFRRMHTQVVGTTNAGKTESVILPWIIGGCPRSS